MSQCKMKCFANVTMHNEMFCKCHNAQWNVLQMSQCTMKCFANVAMHNEMFCKCHNAQWNVLQKSQCTMKCFANVTMHNEMFCKCHNEMFCKCHNVAMKCFANVTMYHLQMSQCHNEMFCKCWFPVNCQGHWNNRVTQVDCFLYLSRLETRKTRSNHILYYTVNIGELFYCYCLIGKSISLIFIDWL